MHIPLKTNLEESNQAGTMQTINIQPPTATLPQNRFFHNPNKFIPGFQKPTGYFPNNQQFRQQPNQTNSIEFDGKRLRKAVARKTVDYNSSIVKYLESRTWQRDYRDRRAVQTDVGYYTDLMPPMSMLENPVNAITTKFVRTSTNKMRCPIFCVAWTPEGRRLITGASSGEFTLWNGLTFNFETILQAHDSPVRCMVWSHNDVWMVTGDHSGYVKYWQSNMNNVKMFQAHKEPLRGISFCPTDTKFVTCSDDGTVRVWDFLRCQEERILRGHGADVKCVAWHPQKSLIVSGSKDSQQPIKLWDPKSGQSLATLHAHKSTVMEVKWNQNGTWMLTASRDHLLKLFDIRNMSQEVQTFRGHKKEATSIAWHPVHESMFVSGGSDGSVMFWVVGADKEVGSMEQAHDSCVWSLAWHPLGHILCTGSNDHTSKFWTRNRPGDRMRDKYNLNTLPRGQDETAEYDEPSAMIPGMGMEVNFQDGATDVLGSDAVSGVMQSALSIPGLDFDMNEDGKGTSGHQQNQPPCSRKVPFSKPIPRQFQQQWSENKQPLLLAPPPPNSSVGAGSNQQQTSQMGLSTVPPPSMTHPPGPPPPLRTPIPNLPNMQQLPPNMQNMPPNMQQMHPNLQMNLNMQQIPMNLQLSGLSDGTMNGMLRAPIPSQFPRRLPPFIPQGGIKDLNVGNMQQSNAPSQGNSRHRGPLLGERPVLFPMENSTESPMVGDSSTSSHQSMGDYETQNFSSATPAFGAEDKSGSATTEWQKFSDQDERLNSMGCINQNAGESDMRNSFQQHGQMNEQQFRGDFDDRSTTSFGRSGNMSGNLNFQQSPMFVLENNIRGVSDSENLSSQEGNQGFGRNNNLDSVGSGSMRNMSWDMGPGGGKSEEGNSEGFQQTGTNYVSQSNFQRGVRGNIGMRGYNRGAPRGGPRARPFRGGFRGSHREGRGNY